MAFGAKGDPAVGYRYDITRVEDSCGWLEEQLKLSQRFFNCLVALQRDKNQAIEDWRVAHSAEYAARTQELEQIGTALDTLYDDIRRESQRARCKVPPTAEQEQRLAELRQCRRQAGAALAAARQAFKGDAEFKEVLKNLNSQHQAAVKEARQEIQREGLHWGNYNAVLASLQGEPFPRFKTFTGVSEGRLSYQFQRDGEATQEAKRAEGKLPKVQPSWPEIEAGLWVEKSPCMRVEVLKEHRKRGKLIKLSMRWSKDLPEVSFCFWMHRPLPEGCRITFFHLTKRQVGYQGKWSISIVVSRKEGFAHQDCAPRGWLAIDWNHRLLPDGSLRVAYWRDHEGQEGQLTLPARLLTNYHQDLQSIRDQHFDECLPLLSDAVAKITDPPEWFAKASENLHLWQSQFRLMRLWERWRQERFPGDEEAIALLARWAERERHLKPWEDHQRGWVQRARRDIYRKWVCEMRRRYHTFVVENIDIRQMRVAPAPDESESPAVRLYRNLAAPGELIAWINQTVAETVRIEPAWSTARCHACHKLTEWEGRLHYQCEHCGATWDCDANAARNLAATYLASLEAEQQAG